jgi:osmotically inducible protein OsmC
MEKVMEAVYTASATSTGDGRNGHVASEDGFLDLDVRIPKEMGGAGGATNPEELFAAGYAACFHSAMKFAGRGLGADLTGSGVSASVSIGTLAGGGFGLAVELVVEAPALDRETALAVAEKAHETCPYSNATRGNIDVTISVL